MHLRALQIKNPSAMGSSRKLNERSVVAYAFIPFDLALDLG